MKYEQAQRRAAMDRRMRCIIPNESYDNHNVNISHCSFKYTLHIHDYETTEPGIFCRTRTSDFFMPNRTFVFMIYARTNSS